MNPLTNVKNITKLNEIELSKGTAKSWHDMYKGSAWIFIGGLSYGLTEGDILAVFSQYGEIVNINLVRDKKTGKTKGFCFLCYANQKSTILAVDNFNGIKLCDRIIRVDHVANYKPPKDDNRDDEITKMLKSEGCAPKVLLPNDSDVADSKNEKKKKKMKKEKKEHKKKKRKFRSDESDDDSKIPSQVKIKIKKEKHDPGYDKYDNISSKDSFTLDRVKQESTSSKSNFLSNKRRQYDSENLGERSNSDKYNSKVNEQDHSNQSRETSHYHSRSVYKDQEKEGPDHAHGEYNKSYKSKEHKSTRSEEKHLKSRASSAERFKDSGNDNSRKSHSKDKYFSRKQHESKNDFSSSSDDDDSSSDSSDSEKHSQSKSSQKHGQDVHDHKRAHDKYGQSYKSRNSDDDDTASKSRHYDQKLERYSDHKSKSREKRKDRYDVYSKSTYHHNAR